MTAVLAIAITGAGRPVGPQSAAELDRVMRAHKIFYDCEASPKLEVLPKRKTADEIAWGSSSEDARFLSNLGRMLGCTEERDRKLLMSFAQKFASKRNGRKSNAA